MDFEKAIEIIKNVIMENLTNEYDGVIVKKLEASNTLDEGRTTKQTHIAISGEQMNIFPYLMADGYFNCNYKDKDGNDKLKYIFTPGPFTKLLKKAQKDPNNYYYLIIEELNRGNAPAIFGEIFQLLDRKDENEFLVGEVGESEYGISNYEVAKEVYEDEEHLVRIPSNMYIIATMNTADQNVFTLDTAFQRRWNMRQIENSFEKSKHSKDMIVGTDINWGAFAIVINDIVIDVNVDMASSEDKRLGTYFAKKKELEADRFSEKVLKYLWDDAFKMDKSAIFNENCKSLEDVVNKYETAKSDKLESVLKADVYEKMLLKMKQKSKENNES